MNTTSEDRLKIAAQEGNINLLYTVIQENPRVLEEVDSIPFVETPLHVAASAGHLQLAVEIMRLKPSFAWKLNLQGFTPIHLALLHGYNRMVLRLIQIDKELVRAKGREGLTPLHLVSQEEDMDLLPEFLKACPSSISDVTIRNETALHIAVKYRKVKALEFLVNWLGTISMDLEKSILNWKDESDNTVLHIAASNSDTEVIALLLESWITLDARNLEGLTALDIAPSEDIKRSLVRTETGIAVIWKINQKHDLFFKSWNEWIIRKTGMREPMSEEARNAYLIVATLVATSMYQAATSIFQVSLSTPGGLGQTNVGTNTTLCHVPSNSSINSNPITGNEGNSIFSIKNFDSFSMTNMFAFMTSIFTIVGLLPKKNAAWLALHFSMLFLTVSYGFFVLLISPTPLTTDVIGQIFVILLTIVSMVVASIFVR